MLACWFTEGHERERSRNKSGLCWHNMKASNEEYRVYDKTMKKSVGQYTHSVNVNYHR